MASSTVEEKGGGPVTDETYDYPEEVFVDGDVSGPGVDDPGSSQVDPDYTTSKKLKEEAEEPKKECGKGAENLKTTLVISGAVVAVIGAIFAIAKKIKEEGDEAAKKESGKGAQILKPALIMSGAVVAAIGIGTTFVIAKKIQQIGTYLAIARKIAQKIKDARQ